MEHTMERNEIIQTLAGSLGQDPEFNSLHFLRVADGVIWIDNKQISSPVWFLDDNYFDLILIPAKTKCICEDSGITLSGDDYEEIYNRFMSKDEIYINKENLKIKHLVEIENRCKKILENSFSSTHSLMVRLSPLETMIKKYIEMGLFSKEDFNKRFDFDFFESAYKKLNDLSVADRKEKEGWERKEYERLKAKYEN